MIYSKSNKKGLRGRYQRERESEREDKKDEYEADTE